MCGTCNSLYLVTGSLRNEGSNKHLHVPVVTCLSNENCNINGHPLEAGSATAIETTNVDVIVVIAVTSNERAVRRDWGSFVRGFPTAASILVVAAKACKSVVVKFVGECGCKSVQVLARAPS